MQVCSMQAARDGLLLLHSAPRRRRGQGPLPLQEEGSGPSSSCFNGKRRDGLVHCAPQEETACVPGGGMSFSVETELVLGRDRARSGRREGTSGRLLGFGKCCIHIHWRRQKTRARWGEESWEWMCGRACQTATRLERASEFHGNGNVTCSSGVQGVSGDRFWV